MADLKPCPFCGGEATLAGFSGNWYVRCDKCLATSDDRALEQTVIDAWNTRAERTCKVTASSASDDYNDTLTRWCFNLSCGHDFEWFEPNPPAHCPDCGGRVVE